MPSLESESRIKKECNTVMKKINNYMRYLKENEISVAGQDIQDDADVDGDIYTIDNDEFILKEGNGYLKMTCMGPG